VTDPATDPFDSIFGDDEPASPRAAFVEQLRRRLESELEDLMATDPTISPIGELDPRLVNPGSLFYLTIPGPDVERSARFYREVFGWELHPGDAGYHVDGVSPPLGLAARDSTDPEVWIEVTDIEAAVARVRELGGSADEPVRHDSGWSGSCRDPQGVRFNLQVPIDEYRSPARSSSEPGELFYWTLPAPDPEASKAFYRELFGWEYSPPGEQGGIHITNRLPDGGLGGAREGTAPELYFRVADLEAAMEAVRAAGGTAEPIGEGSEGRHAICADDQGVPFGISQPAPGY
jgi:predicted enzyme related to lactoylglutathione lyase